jgi:hypothetical protein
MTPSHGSPPSRRESWGGLDNKKTGQWPSSQSKAPAGSSSWGDRPGAKPHGGLRRYPGVKRTKRSSTSKMAFWQNSAVEKCTGILQKRMRWRPRRKSLQPASNKFAMRSALQQVGAHGLHGDTSIINNIHTTFLIEYESILLLRL